MRVCFIGKYEPGSRMAGGIEKYSQQILSHKSGVDFTPIFFGSRHFPIKFTLLESPFPSIKSFMHALKGDFDVIHINIPNPFVELVLLFYLLLRRKSKLVATYHANAPHYTLVSYIADALRMLWLLPLLSRCERIISTSKEYAGNSITLRPFRNKIFIVPMGIDTRNHIKKKTKADKKIIFVGRLYRYKGLKVLLDAMGLVNHLMDGVKLQIVGDGPMKKELTEKCESLRLYNVTFVGRVSDNKRDELLRKSDIFVLPSINKAEAFGISQLDAMQFGIPVISTNIRGSGVPYVNKNGETGIVVEPNDPRQLADAIIKLLGDKKLSSKLGRNARDRTMKHFTQKIMVKRTIDLYKSLI